MFRRSVTRHRPSPPPHSDVSAILAKPGAVLTCTIAPNVSGGPMNISVHGGGHEIAQLIELLTPMTGRYIRDKTGLTGRYDFDMKLDLQTLLTMLKWFNRLYLQVTRGVRQAVAGTSFRDARFMTELDVVFANLYFAAIAAGDADASRAPSAWRPLLRARSRPGIARLQFALAGMNAHINRDLPQGIVDVFEALGGDPSSDRVRRQDFDSVNDLLERVEGEVKAEFSVGLVGVVDRVGGRVDDVVTMWNVCAARAAAWTNAEVLWTLRVTPRIRAAFFETLDKSTGLAGRGLLTPTGLDLV